MRGKERLLAYLEGACTGREAMVKSADLERALHMSRNAVQEQVGRLRREAVPVCSGPGGYYYAASAGDIYRAIRFLRRQTEHIQGSIRGLEAALETFRGNVDGQGGGGDHR